MQQYDCIKIFRIIGFFGFSILACPLWADPNDQKSGITLSVENVVSEALRNNPDLIAADGAVAMARGERRLAGQWKNPEIFAEYGEKRVGQTTGGLNSKGDVQKYHVGQTFEFPGKASLRKAIADRNIDLAELALTQLRQEVAARARLLVIEWITAKQEVEVAAQVEEQHEALVEQLRKRALGSIQSDIDRRIIEADRIRILAQSHKTEERKLAAQVALNVLCGKSPDSFVEVKASLELKPLNLQFDALLEEAARNNLGLKSQKIEISRSTQQLEQARLGAAPDITIGPFFSEETASERERAVGIGISLPLPLWDSHRGQVDVAKGNVVQAQARESKALRNLQQELSQQYHAYQHILHLLERVPLNSLDELRQASEFADRQYRLGAIPVQIYLETQDKYLEAASTLLETLFEGHEHFLNIQLLTNDAFLGGHGKKEGIQ